MENITIFGAGGHAKVIIDILERQGAYHIEGIFVDTPNVRELMGYPVLGNISDCCSYKRGIIAIGDNFDRQVVTNKIKSLNPDFKFINAIHPNATIGKEVTIGYGSVVSAGAIINAHALIGNHCIINTNATVEHDVIIGDYSTVGPSSTIGGNSIIGRLSNVSLGANVIQKIKVGDGTLIGAGSTVINELPAGVLAYGIPARVIRKRDPNEKYL
ncbi:hypothetical protein RJ53_01455 [Methanocalculus chunghsingensis]|uniref:PglD N-terminal domain-containing protein n=2 Tax=Methanocalculus chunghsingensis TaxID=156457 RepID=A0A8J8B3I7_9EURY|nr:hypothetical protein [Methanocalculus chunghsingensis]